MRHLTLIPELYSFKKIETPYFINLTLQQGSKRKKQTVSLERSGPISKIDIFLRAYILNLYSCKYSQRYGIIWIIKTKKIIGYSSCSHTKAFIPR